MIGNKSLVYRLSQEFCKFCRENLSRWSAAFLRRYILGQIPDKFVFVNIDRRSLTDLDSCLLTLKLDGFYVTARERINRFRFFDANAR